MNSHVSAAERSACPTCGKPDAEPPTSVVRALERRIAELEAENVRLTAASNYFGALAERLNERLQQRQTRHASGSGVEATPQGHAHQVDQS